MLQCCFGNCDSDCRAGRPGYDRSTRFYSLPKPCLAMRESVKNWSKQFEKQHVKGCKQCRLCRDWMMKCNREDYKYKSVLHVATNTFICSKHFEDVPPVMDYEKCRPTDAITPPWPPATRKRQRFVYVGRVVPKQNGGSNVSSRPPTHERSTSTDEVLGSFDESTRIRKDLESSSSSHQSPSDVIQIEEEPGNGCSDDNRRRSQSPIKLDSERNIETATAAKLEPLKTKDEDHNANSPRQTDPSAASSHKPDVVQIKEECECELKQSCVCASTEPKSNQDISAESETAISPVESESVGADDGNRKLMIAASQDATSRDDCEMILEKSCEDIKIQIMGQRASVSQSSNTAFSEIKEGLNSDYLASRGFRTSVEIESEAVADFNTVAFQVDAEPVGKSEEQVRSFLVDGTGASSSKDDSVRTSGEDTLVCDLCPFQSELRPKFNEHLRAHLNGHFFCEFCGYTTEEKRDMLKHRSKHEASRGYRLENDHNMVKMYCCNYCDYRTPNKSRISYHQKERPFVCWVCNYKTDVKANLIMHQRKHTVRASNAIQRSKIIKVFLCCDLCGFESNSTSSFDSHLETHHLNKPFSCKTCDYRTNIKANLTSHVRRHRRTP